MSPIAGIDTGVGKFGLTWNNTFLSNYDVIVPITGRHAGRSAARGPSRAARRRASPSGSRSASSTGTGTAFGASLTGRYISKLEEARRQRSWNSRFYTDFQLRWTSPSFADNFELRAWRQQPVQDQGAGLLHLRHQQLRSDDVRCSGPLFLRPGKREDVRRPPRRCQRGRAAGFGRPPFSVVRQCGLNIAAFLPM